MSVEDDEKLIKEVWGSEDNLYDFFWSEIERLGPIICGKNALLPQIQLGISEGDPMDMIFGRSLAKSGSYRHDRIYHPNGLITVLPTAYASKPGVTTAIAHELIHHWERLKKRQLERVGFRYPKSADRLISRIFRDKTKEKNWRRGHSNNFIAKSQKVAKLLRLPLPDILVHRKRPPK